MPLPARSAHLCVRRLAEQVDHVVCVVKGPDGAPVALVDARHAAQAHALEVGGRLAQHAPVERVEEARGLAQRGHGRVARLEEEAQVVVAHAQLLHE
jgi:hypothetical protein